MSGPLAGIYFAWLEEIFVKMEIYFQIIFWRRMKDDVFLYGSWIQMSHLITFEDPILQIYQSKD